jgi:hypothetical protein
MKCRTCDNRTPHQTGAMCEECRALRKHLAELHREDERETQPHRRRAPLPEEAPVSHRARYLGPQK